MFENVTRCGGSHDAEEHGDLVALIDAFNQWMHSLEVTKGPAKQ